MLTGDVIGGGKLGPDDAIFGVTLNLIFDQPPKKHFFERIDCLLDDVLDLCCLTPIGDDFDGTLTLEGSIVIVYHIHCVLAILLPEGVDHQLFMVVPHSIVGSLIVAVIVDR